jgi:hypothetical protein
VRALVVLVLAIVVIGCSRESEPEVASVLLEITPPTSSWFESERLPLDPAQFGCVGIVEEHGESVIVTATESGLVFVRPGATGWSVETIAIEPGWLDDRVLCAAADLAGDAALEFLVVDGHGGVMISRDDETFVVEQLPAFPVDWTEDPLPHHDAEAGAVALVDLDDDGRLDIYVARTQAGAASLFMAHGCTSSVLGDVECGDGSEALGFPDVALRNVQDHEFVLLVPPPLDLQGQCAGTIDLDDDGRQELIVCNDGAANHVLSLGPHGWEDRTVELGLDVYNHGMGIAAGDLDGDGKTDLVFSDIGTPLVMFGHDEGYEIANNERGIAAVRQVAWGVAAEDFDNDGDLDVLFENDVFSIGVWNQYYCGGRCEFPASQPTELLLYRNDGHGLFAAERGVVDELPEPQRGDGLAVADLDRDGLLDGVIVRDLGAQQRDLWVLHGRSSEDFGWIEVAAPIGARVRACSESGECRMREVMGGSSVRAISSEWVHFGLAVDEAAYVSVEWPRGTIAELGRVASGTRVRFSR